MGYDELAGRSVAHIFQPNKIVTELKRVQKGHFGPKCGILGPKCGLLGSQAATKRVTATSIKVD